MKTNTINRRKVIAGIGAGLASIAIKPALANSNNVNMEIASTTDLEDPTT